MTIAQALALGMLQGFTEFLPVSSSGHLVILQGLFGLKEPQVAFDIFLHLGTTVSVFIFFSKFILRLFGEDKRLLFFIALASIPTFIIGFLFKGAVEVLFGMPGIVGVMLALTGIWLILATFLPRYLTKSGTKRCPGFTSSLLIGIAQGIAVVPGISRSGMTIGAGMLTGLDKEMAFKFSMVLSIPAVLGASVLKAHSIGSILVSHEAFIFLTGGIAAMLVGLFAIRVLLGFVRTNRLYVFGVYCILVGCIVALFYR
ncbi:MAG: undecaprenyl-diphosphate phosphatase [Candidatus Omnitrophota bacterium]|nr:undecaprenyl-diphosphate phosphatase [Candidatus Omnitrophota bacterium]